MAGHAYDAVLFDLDGTLVAPEFEHVRSIFDEVGRQLDHHFADETASRLWHGLGGPRNDQLRELGVDVAEFWRVFDETEDPQDRAAAMDVFDDAAIAADLEVPTALVTHCPPEPTAAVLQHHGIGDWFDAVVSCSDDLGWKPDPGPIEHALGEIGMEHLVADGDSGGRIATDGGRATTGAVPGAPTEPPAGALYVGDTAGDVGAAWNAGLDALYVGRVEPERRGQCVLGDHRVNSLTDVSF